MENKYILQGWYNGSMGRVVAVIVMVLIGCGVGNSQSVYRLGRKVVNGGVKVERVVRVNGGVERGIARRLLKGSELRKEYIEPVRIPSVVIGPNMYLKGIGNRFRGQAGWQGIGRSDGYNGAHHVVTRRVIREIGGNGKDIFANAPSVFHPFHNRPEYAELFHNHQRQLELYDRCGIKCVMEDFLERIGEVNKREGLPEYSEKSKEQLMLEAQLWAEHWGFVWER